jgi:hypothetical protein
MEPMLPAVGDRSLEDLAAALIAKSSALTASLNPNVANSLRELVRSMNCYYSNLIEGHKTHPLDIDRALANDLSEEPKKRSLQLEAKAHIEVQRLIDRGQDRPDTVCRRGNSGGKVAETLFSFAARGAVGWCFRSGKSGGNYRLQRTASEVGFERFS